MSRQGDHILVVEDFDPLRTLVIRVLKAEGYEAFGAVTSLDAAAQLEAGHFELLITDHEVPEGDGTAIAREAVAANPGLSVLFISGSPESSLDLEVPGTRTGFLQKPFDIDTLIERVSELLADGKN